MDRRTVIKAGVVAGGVVVGGTVLAACSSDANSDAGDTPETDAGTAADTETGPEALGTVAVSSIAVGGGVIVEDPAVVVTRPTEAEVFAFTSICPHQGCRVNEVRDNEIVCPCHGSLFSATDGSVISGPAAEGLAAAPFAVDGDSVTFG